jgi:bifunctional ADP-heptose synthase (sugar kinase/adenylyltransferase)
MEVRRGMSANVLENLKSFGVNVEHRTNTEKIIKTRYIDERYNHHILRLDRESKLYPFRDILPNGNYDAVVISDYDKGFLTFDKILQIVETYQCPIFIDSKKTTLPDRDECFIKINQREYGRLQVKLKNVIVTLGERGALYRDELYPTDKVPVSDLVGAGDTFLAALTYDYLYTKDISHAIMFANKAAAIAVQHPGTYVLQEKDVEYLNSLNVEVK